MNIHILSQIINIHILDMSGQFMVLFNWLGANVSDPLDFLKGMAPDLVVVELKTGADACLDCLTQDSDDAVSEPCQSSPIRCC